MQPSKSIPSVSICKSTLESSSVARVAFGEGGKKECGACRVAMELTRGRVL